MIRTHSARITANFKRLNLPTLKFAVDRTHSVRSTANFGCVSDEVASGRVAALLVEEGGDEFLRIEGDQIVDCFADSDELDRDPELSLDSEHDPALS